MRRTKIVCTLGPASASKNVIKQMILAGMNVARFNMSHGNHESHHQLISLLKEAREELNKPVAIMIDTRGPEIRIRQFQNGFVNIKKVAFLAVSGYILSLNFDHLQKKEKLSC